MAHIGLTTYGHMTQYRAHGSVSDVFLLHAKGTPRPWPMMLCIYLEDERERALIVFWLPSD